VVLGADSVVVGTPFEVFTVRVQSGRARAVGEQLELARWAAAQFRVGIGMGDPALVRAAQELVRLLDGGARGFASQPAAFSRLDDSFGGIAARLEEELFAGRLVVDREQLTPLSDRPELFDVELPPLPPAQRESGTRSFEVRFVDEVGKAISGIDAEFTADGAQTRSTNAAGIALLEGVNAGGASVALLDPVALAKVLDPRWDSFRRGTPPKESNTTEVVFRGAELGPFALKAELTNTVVIKPPLGKLFAELWDKTGRVRHANQTYQISGPQALEGTSDADGRLRHDGVFPGDYRLSLALEFFEENDPDRAVDIVESQLVVLDPTAGKPEVRMLGAVPRSVLARLHMFFNTNKAFLLPTALPSVRKLRRLYEDNTPCKLLVVGHADTSAGPAYNDKLSLERAQATIAYLKDDVEAWFKLYSHDDAKKRWGKVEDLLMIRSMPGFVEKFRSEEPVRWFQRTRRLKVDGAAGSDTRHALIEEYMSLDGASLADFAGEIEAVAHGCGENFPLDDSGEELDQAPEDNKRDPIDRRVELFFFDAEFGITPPPPGPNSQPDSPEYPLWRKRVVQTVDLRDGDLTGPKVTFVEIADAHFRTDSAVVMPEGENPDATGDHQSFSAVGLIGSALAFNDAHGGRSLLVAGHTDTVAGDSLNDELSRQRAQLTLALLEGDRDSYKTLADKRHKPADINQILSWVSQAFTDLDFNCDPGKITDSVDPSKVRAFQSDYNANKAALGSSAADLTVDGTVGALTWGAFFDCFELALQQELGETESGVATSRSGLKFVDNERKSLGFGERFPIEELGVDSFVSQTNRRVEIIFFEPGEEPNLADAEADPETSELYLPGFFQRVPVPRAALPVTTGNLATRLSSRFSRARSFPKPSIFPGLLDIASKLAADPSLTLVLVGHADASGTDDANQKISLARAEAVRALLLGDRKFFLARFKDHERLTHWEWEEVQWMLYTARFGGSRCYVGAADGFPGLRTVDALGAFQLSTDDLSVSYSLDDLTLGRLVDAYLAGMDPTTRPSAAQISVVGGGSWHPPIPMGPTDTTIIAHDSPDLRRVEAFLFKSKPKPPVTSFPKQRAAPVVYRRWCSQVQTAFTIPRPPLAIEVFDGERLPLGNASVQIALIVPDGQDTPMASITTSASGNVDLALPEGVYAAQVQLGGGIAFAASFAIDDDESCGVALSFDARRDGLSSDTTGPT
jgi:outer membrane protein OmpA-like peptidoglycan-associated protein